MSLTKKQHIRIHYRLYGFKGALRVFFRPFYKWLGYTPDLLVIDVDEATMIKQRSVMQRTIFGIYSFLNHRRKLSLLDVWAPIISEDELDSLSFLIKETDYRVDKEAQIDKDKAHTKSFYLLTGVEVMLEKNISNALFMVGLELLFRELYASNNRGDIPDDLKSLLSKIARGEGEGGIIRIKGPNPDDDGDD